MTDYHTPESLVTDLQALAQAHPTLAKYGVAGRSVQGRLIPYIQVGLKAQPSLFIDANIHGNEKIAEICAFLWAKWLLDNYGNDPDATKIVNGMQTTIIPMANPDGNAAGTRTNGDGVDCNRNFDCKTRKCFCLPPNELVIGTEAKPISEYHVGELVRGSDGGLHPVSSIFSRQYHGQLVLIEPYYSFPISLTGEHPVLYKEGAISRWVPASLVRRGYVFYPKLTCSCLSSLTSLSDEEYGRLVGYYLAEGYASFGTNTSIMGLTFHRNEDCIEDSLDLMTRLYEAPTGINEVGNAISFYWRKKKMVRSFLENFGGKSHVKRLPRSHLALSRNFLRGILTGYFRGDGSLTQGFGTGAKATYRVRFSTSSLTLAHQLRQAAATLGVFTSIECVPSRSWKIEARTGFSKPQFVLSVPSGYLSKARELLQIDNDGVNGTKYRQLALESREGYWLKVRSVSIRPYTGLVYNLEIPHQQDYLTSSFIVHNCQGGCNTPSPGPAPYSEPETKAIQGLFFQQPYTWGLSYHSGTEVLAYPWGCFTDVPKDEPAFMRMANAINAEITRRGQQPYSSGQIIQKEAMLAELHEEKVIELPSGQILVIYQACGTATDFYYSYGTLSYVNEISNDFTPPSSEIDMIFARQIGVPFTISKTIASPGVTLPPTPLLIAVGLAVAIASAGLLVFRRR